MSVAIGIGVITRKHIQTCRETITPASQDQVKDLIEALISMARVEKITGHIHLGLTMGGVRTIHVERVEEKAS